MRHLSTSPFSVMHPQSAASPHPHGGSSSQPSQSPSVSTPVALKVDGMQTFLCQFDRGIDALVYLYLQSVAIDGMVSLSGYAMAHQLGLYRVTLSRILRRLEQCRAISIMPSDDNGNHLHSVCIHLLLTQESVDTLADENVTSSVENVTPIEENDITIGANVTPAVENVTPIMENVTPIAENNAPIMENFTPLEANVTPAAATDEPKKKNKNEKAPTTPKEKNKRKTPPSRARNSAKTFDERRQAFIDSLTPFIPTYGMEMINAFADYWTEPNRSCSRMRFELQRTWSLPLRLATWARHDRVFAQRTAYPHRPTSNECVIQAQQWAIAESARIVREAEMSRRQQGQHLWSEGIFHNDNSAARQALLPF